MRQKVESKNERIRHSDGGQEGKGGNSGCVRGGKSNRGRKINKLEDVVLMFSCNFRR